MNRYARKSLKILLWLVCGIVALIGLVYVLIQLPYVQNIAKNKAVAFLHDKIKTPVSIGKFSLDFPRKIVLEDIFLEDQQGDTLFAADTIRVDISLWRLLVNHVQVHSLDVRGLQSNVYTLPDSTYNFQYIIDAFITEQTKSPDTSAAMRFTLDKVNLERIRVTMNDTIGGNDMTMYLHHLDAKINDFNLDTEFFRVPSVRLNGLDVSLRQWKEISEETATTDTTSIAPKFSLPDIELGEIDLADVAIEYENQLSAVDTKLDLKHLRIEFNELDLPNQRADIKVIQLDTTSGSFALGDRAQDAVEATAEEVAATLEQGWTIAIERLALNSVNYKYDDLNSKPVKRGIDYKHLGFTNIQVDAKDVYYNADTISANVDMLAFTEQSGLQLDTFQAEVFYSDKLTRLSNLLIETPYSHISNDIEISYPSIDSIEENIGLVGINASFEKNEIAVRDLLLAAPFLAKRNFINKSPNGIIRLDGSVDGLVSDLDISNLELSGLGDIQFKGSGNLFGLPDVNRASFDLRIDELTMTSSDMRNLIPRNSMPTSIELPGYVSMRGAFRGSLKSFTTDMQIRSDFGAVDIDGTLGNITTRGRESYNAVITTSQFNLGKLLRRSDEIGTISLTMKVMGTGTDPKTANATVSGTLRELTYKGYTYQNLTLDGSADDGALQVKASMQDPNIDFALTGTGNLQGEYPSVNMTMQLNALNLQPLRLHEKEIRLKGTIVADLPTADPDHLNGTIAVSDAVIGYEGESYKVDTLGLWSVATAEGDSLHFFSEFLVADLHGQYNLTKLVPALRNSIDQYFDTSPGVDSSVVYEPQEVFFTANLYRSPIVEQLLPDLTQVDDARLEGHFDSSTDVIVLKGSIPRLRYQEFTIDDLAIDVHTENDALLYAVTLDQINSEQLRVLHPSLSGSAADDLLSIDLLVKDGEENDQYRINGEITAAPDHFAFHVLPQGLLLNQEDWTVSQDNAIEFGKSGIRIRNFTMSHAEQSLAIASEPMEWNAPFDLKFDKFNIETVTRLISKDSLLAGGTMNGTANVRNLDTYPVFTADLVVDRFSFHGDTVGDITLKVNNEQQNTYAAEVRITGEGNEVDLVGKYYDEADQSRFDLQVYMNRLNMKSIEGFTGGEIDKASGYVSGGFDIKGTVSQPQIRGDVRFHDVGFTVTRFNSYFKARDEYLEFTSTGVALNDFTLVDTAGNEAVFSGFVNTTDYREFDLDLDLQADNFQVLNSTRRDNKLYFGKLFIDAHVHVLGDLDSPTVDGSVWVNEETDLTIVVPQEDPGIVEREGIVLFVDMDTFQLERHLAVEDTLALTGFTGMNVAVNITIVKEASLNLIIDEANGDYLNVKGTANLTGGIDPSGKLTLSGLYDIEEGAYRYSFEQVRREFKIQKGSTIQWTGDPYTADIRVKAVYTANTAPLTLVQKQLVEADQAVINTYKQKVPFQVQLNLTGELMRPEVAFDIDLPERNYGVSSEIVSTVRTRLAELRTEPSELNKQVFALLVLNRFIAEDPFQASPREGGIESLARQSVSKLLSEQLNNIIGGSVAGFDVSLDINSIEDYTTGELQNRTDVSVALTRRLLDDRLTISVGSNFEVEGPQETDRKTTNIAGDVSAEYQLSKDGRYSVRAYRKDEYIVVQGQVVETGVGFVFTTDYEHVKDIFRKRTEEERFTKKQRRKAMKEIRQQNE